MSSLCRRDRARRGDGTADRRPAASTAVRARTGFDLEAPLLGLDSDEAGTRHVRMETAGRVELVMGRVDGGYLESGAMTRALPIGSSVEPATGTFTWTPGVGSYGVCTLTFLRDGARIPVKVSVLPAEAAAGRR